MGNTYKHEYDRVISLGMDCRPKVIMDITGLSGKRTALDVIGTQKLECLIHVLSTRFSDIFLEENLREQTNSDEVFKRIRDTHTDYISIHDFPPNAESISSEYPAFKTRFDKHVDTFFHDIQHYRRVLFILNLEMAPTERDYTDDLNALESKLPVLRKILDTLCNNENNQLLVATYHKTLLSLKIPRTHIVLKHSEWKEFMRGAELEAWQGWLDGITIAEASRTYRPV
ncbi:DUF1796 family putative cysteine peptidase [Vibrio metschnikovii]|uniref:DUF1796 family putative cysteine peptidase n=1 Tax=Vibrio metschnikovii TaxID=28172 RepID=UPI0023B016F5|nr:DUF1796 family putative cysteine peptidase [Vibrio metschnikovii]